MVSSSDEESSDDGLFQQISLDDVDDSMSTDSTRETSGVKQSTAIGIPNANEALNQGKSSPTLSSIVDSLMAFVRKP